MQGPALLSQQDMKSLQGSERRPLLVLWANSHFKAMHTPFRPSPDA